MSAICTNYFDIFDNNFLIESKKNWPWKDASIDKYEPTYKQLNSIKRKDSLKIVKRYYKIHLISYKPYYVHKSRIKISLKSTHTFHTLKNCLTAYDGHRSFYNAIQILLYFCWNHKLIYFRKNDNSLLPIVKIYMELSPDEQVMWLPGLNWARKLYSLIAWQGIFLFQSTFFSVLGGAYSALGRYKKEHAEKAKHLARNQIVLAKKLQDPVLECKCWIYYAEGLIQLGKFKKAALIIERQKNMVMDMLKGDDTLLSMCENAKLKLMVNSRK